MPRFSTIGAGASPSTERVQRGHLEDIVRRYLPRQAKRRIRKRTSADLESAPGEIQPSSLGPVFYRRSALCAKRDMILIDLTGTR